MREEVLKELEKIIGEDWVISDPERLKGYLLDETPTPIRPRPAEDVVLVKPRSTQQVSAVLRLANKFKIPVFPRGGGTGLVGACIPTMDGIIISLERMNKITVDKENLMAEVEAGATLADLLKAADEAGLFFPPHPGDEGAQIGGLIACNAGGARAVRTGVMRNYVKGLEVVLPTGEVLRMGGRLLKDNAGYDLMQLIIGSEGTLGIITKAWIRLYPKLPATATIIIPFNNRGDAIKAVPKILQSGIIPLALEYVEKKPIERSAEHLGLKWPCESGQCFLIMILAESSQDVLYEEAEKVMDICESLHALEPILAESREEQERILKIRSEIYSSIKPDTVDILDTTVPPAVMDKLMEVVDRLAEKYGTYMPVYGHAGDGNLHIHLMREERWSKEDYDKIRDEIYKAAVELGGTITGEHGIGYARKSSAEKYLTPLQLKLMREIKRIFDPNNILNPDKVIP